MTVIDTVGKPEILNYFKVNSGGVVGLVWPTIFIEVLIVKFSIMNLTSFYTSESHTHPYEYSCVLHVKTIDKPVN